MAQPIQRLPERAAVSVAGPDSANFLQGLVTADAGGLAEGGATYAALLTPQGKILNDFILYRGSGGYLIDCAASQKAALVKRLGFYRLRARIEIAALDELAIAVSTGPIERGYADPRTIRLGYRAFFPLDASSANGDYHARRIAEGIADSDADIGSGELFPHEANLDQLGGISFAKGCYVGQEVVSRMEHRGTARSRILPVVLSGPAPAKGTAVLAGARQVGTLLSSAGERALALLRLDRLFDAAAAGEALLTEAVALRVVKPEWARFQVPQVEPV